MDCYVKITSFFIECINRSEISFTHIINIINNNKLKNDSTINIYTKYKRQKKILINNNYYLIS
jgi:hypothetical protein